MKHWGLILTLLAGSMLHAADWSTVRAVRVIDPTVKTEAHLMTFGTMTFRVTDENDHPINYQVGGGGLALSKAYSCDIRNGALQPACLVPNPRTTAPAGIRYRIEVSDGVAIVLRLTNVSFVDDFDLDAYIPSSTPIPLGQYVDDLTVGVLRVISGCTGCGTAPPDSGGAVTSVFTRTGDVTARATDYASFYAALLHNHDTAYASKSSEHTHTNKSALDKVTQDVAGNPLWNGSAWPGGGVQGTLPQSVECDKITSYNAGNGQFTCGIDQTGAPGGGSNVSVNGVSQSDVNLNSTTPSAESGYVQAKVQNSAGSVSVEVPTGTTSTTAAPGNHNHAGTYEAANANIQAHIARTDNPHQVSAAQAGALPSNTVLPKSKSDLQKVLSSYNATTGDFQNVQLACGDLSNAGNGCQRSVGTTAGTLMDGADSRVTGALPANGASWSGQELQLPGTDHYVGIPDGGTAAANKLTSTAGVLFWGLGPLAQKGEVTTGSVSGSSSVELTITWAPPFPDATYGIGCSVIVAGTTGANLRFAHVTERAADHIKAVVVNDDSSAHTGVLSCTGVN